MSKLGTVKGIETTGDLRQMLVDLMGQIDRKEISAEDADRKIRNAGRINHGMAVEAKFMRLSGSIVEPFKLGELRVVRTA